jgi:hypothetical protein
MIMIMPRLKSVAGKLLRPGLVLLCASLALLCLTGVMESRVISGVLHPLDAAADSYSARSMRDSVVVFGSAKTINAGISLIKSADFSAGAFISASFNPFEVLDPIDDLIEKFADILLLVTIFNGLLKAAVEVGQIWGVFVAGGAFLLATVAFLMHWIAPGKAAMFARLTALLTIIAIMLRVGIPAAITCSGLVSDTVLGAQFEQARASLEAVAASLAPPVTGRSVIEGSEALYQFVKSISFATIFQSFEQLLDAVFSLAVVFGIRVIVAPLTIGWLFYRLSARIIDSSSAGEKSALQEAIGRLNARLDRSEKVSLLLPATDRAPHGNS